jgi:hypothetical protein
MQNEINHAYWFASGNLSGPSTRYRVYYPLVNLKNKKSITSDFIYPSLSPNSILNFFYTFCGALFFRKKTP